MLVEKLLYSIIQDNDSVSLYKIKDRYLKPKEKTQVDFVKDYYAKYMKLPDVATVSAKFGTGLTQNNAKGEYWLNELIDAYKRQVIENAVITAARNKNKALQVFQEAIVEHNTDLDTEIHTYNKGADRLKEYNKRKTTGGISYVSTGSDDLDEISSGFKRADLWTIGGREGIGKSWYLFRMAIWLDFVLMNSKRDQPILIVSGEMDALEVEDRLDAMRCKISYSRLSKGALDPQEELVYKRFLGRGFKSNIVVVDSFNNLQDIEYFMTIYRPICCFIDGSHLLSSSYEWTELAKVTAKMKKMTRNKKIPIINTTHLKGEKGKSAEGGDIDDFAYTKGYTRDSDIASVMYASDMMEIENKIGLDFVKVRRGSRTQLIYQHNYDTCEIDLVESKVGAAILASTQKKGSALPTPPPAIGRRGGASNSLIP
tara:strand:+ start:51928 stop:53208 length:1281 start_codon:yes stop_codon:yes gene_type:complete